MGLISTPFLTYREIKTADSDLIEDAFALRTEFSEVYEFLGSIDCRPRDAMVEQLVKRISERKQQSATG